MYLEQLSSYGCPSCEASLEMLAKQKANQSDGVVNFDHRGVRHGFWRGPGQNETHRKGSEHTQFVYVVCVAVCTALVPLHRETLADVRRL